MTLPPAVTIHGLDHAKTALNSRRPVLLLSAPGAALYAGCLWWRAVIAASGSDQPDAIDCADAPGRALEALETGCRIIILAPCAAWDVIAERTYAAGGVLLRDRPPALDLATSGSFRQLSAWLGAGHDPG